MKIIINQEIYLAQIKNEDKSALLKFINDKDIYNNTLKIPFPYTKEDADYWINFVEQSKKETGFLKHWAIKNDNELIGRIGLHSKYGQNSHKDEIGYWLGKPFWNKGIMTEAVKKFCSLAFSDFNLIRIEAAVFTNNNASKRVLEKTGFVCEGTQRKAYLKDEEFIDADIYALIK